MSIKIVLIQKKSILSPESKLPLNNATNHLTFIESIDFHGVVRTPSNQLTLSPSTFTICNVQEIISRGKDLGVFRAIIFSRNEESEHPWVQCSVNHLCENTMQSFRKVRQLFIRNNPSPDQIETACRGLFELGENYREDFKKKGDVTFIDPRLIKVNRFIRKKFTDQDISLNTLSALINCSPNHLCNSYSRIFGISPVRHIRKLRLQLAIALLQDTNTPINKISQQVGFSSLPHFSMFIKKEIGTNPSHIRSSRVK